MRAILVLLLALTALPALAQQSRPVSLRLGGSEVTLSPLATGQLAARARALMARCGPNTALHPGNFGQSVGQTEMRLRQTLDGSRLAIVFTPPLETQSLLGGALPAGEAVIGLERDDLFVGPYFTNGPGGPVEHLQCDYLAALELACSAELAAYLPARYRETCARLERDPQGRLVMPPADVAPSCS